ncbi:hypothetical protein Salat_2118700 [Sesamum alatum]|uniref:Transmembrane protein n=1 Tax=Sesamum alatum TaxID=300844 RepID=A0AAE1Y1S5_9LAMI|nr:hypothetical protein Salat_2118700 [Sesamum alatum]
MENRTAVQHALFEVNMKHDTKIVLPWAMATVQQLQQRHEVFNWLVAYLMSYATALCALSLLRTQFGERKLAKCYVNAYEDLLEELNELFALPAQDDHAPENAVAVDEGDQVVPEVPAAVDGDVLLTETSRHRLRVASPGIPFYITKKKSATPEKSPTSSSPGPVSSSASNATPIKKQD